MIERLVHGKPSLNGACAGVVAGLVVITPSAGFIQPYMALLAGVLGSCWCFTAVEFIKNHTSLDDTCDTFGVHGMAGFLGTIFVGVLSDPDVCECTGDVPPAFCKMPNGETQSAPEWCANPGTVARSFNQFWIQSICAVAAAAYSMVMTYILMLILMYFNKRFFGTGLLKTLEEQESARDEEMHGESAYELEELLAIQLGLPLEDDDEYEWSDDNGHGNGLILTPGRKNSQRKMSITPRETPRNGLLC
jgi:Amt family ammonium transporter